MYRLYKSDYIDMMMSKHQSRNGLGMTLIFYLQVKEELHLFRLFSKKVIPLFILYYVDGNRMM